MRIRCSIGLVFLNISLLFPFILSSCCTKEKCLGPQTELPLKVNSSGENLFFKVFVKSDRGVSLIDSYEILGKKILTTSIDFDYLNPLPSKYTILFGIDDEMVDSLTNFGFEKVKGKIDCGTCFPLGRGSQEVQKIQNLNFSYNDKSLGINDTVFIGF